jgi:hypothetical protein
MAQLVAPLADLVGGGQDPVHRPLAREVPTLVEQRRVDGRRAGVDEALTVEHVEHRAALLGGQGKRRTASRLRGPGRPRRAVSIGGRPADAERPAGAGHADLGRHGEDRLHQDPLS